MVGDRKKIIGLQEQLSPYGTSLCNRVTLPVQPGEASRNSIISTDERP